MPRLAFYAPLKSPRHPVPSGDRTLARLLLRGLRLAGWQVELASSLRSYDGVGDPRQQQRLKARAERRAAALIAAYRARPPEERPQAWFTYHLYHKAPDWIGPAVCRALGIPYLLCEASHAPQQEGGLWQDNLSDCVAAIRQAARIFIVNPRDEPGLATILANPLRVLRRLPPFIDTTTLARRRPRGELAREAGLDPARPWLISVAMLRPGDKMASYRLMAACYRRLLAEGRHLHWLIVGDGAAAAELDALIADLPGAVRLGALDPPAAAPWLAASQLCVWPAVNESFGMALLEAQAAGCPVVAGYGAGVAGIVDAASGRLVHDCNVERFSAVVATLLDDWAVRRAMAEAGPHYVREHHSLGRAAALLRAYWPGPPVVASAIPEEAVPAAAKVSRDEEKPHPDL
nr:glycosyltransferase family 4 protein [uncultured Pseudogulbenkiania sp.]